MENMLLKNVLIPVRWTSNLHQRKCLNVKSVICGKLIIHEKYINYKRVNCGNAVIDWIARIQSIDLSVCPLI